MFVWAIGIICMLSWAAAFALFGNHFGWRVHIPLVFGLIALGYAALTKPPYAKVTPPTRRDARTRA